MAASKMINHLCDDADQISDLQTRIDKLDERNDYDEESRMYGCNPENELAARSKCRCCEAGPWETADEMRAHFHDSAHIITVFTKMLPPRKLDEACHPARGHAPYVLTRTPPHNHRIHSRCLEADTVALARRKHTLCLSFRKVDWRSAAHDRRVGLRSSDRNPITRRRLVALALPSPLLRQPVHRLQSSETLWHLLQEGSQVVHREEPPARRSLALLHVTSLQRLRHGPGRGQLRAEPLQGIRLRAQGESVSSSHDPEGEVPGTASWSVRTARVCSGTSCTLAASPGACSRTSCALWATCRADRW